MLRSMYSGISGMKNFQTKLDVIGNNIANVNTFGFKKGRVTFKDMVSQTISGASAGDANRGGVNPKQVGLGSQLASIDTIDTQGSLQTTGRVLDVGIQGDGYLVVQDGGGYKYTRAGNLFFDDLGRLVTSSGDFVLGYTRWTKADGSYDDFATEADASTNTPKPIQIHIIVDNNGYAHNPYEPDGSLKNPAPAGTEVKINQISNLSIGEDGTVTFTYDGKNYPLFSIAVARFPNNGGLEKIGENYYIQTNASGAAVRGLPNDNGAGKIVSGSLEMSNVDLSEEFTEMIVAQRGFQANTRIITTSDEILQELVNLKR